LGHERNRTERLGHEEREKEREGEGKEGQSRPGAGGGPAGLGCLGRKIKKGRKKKEATTSLEFKFET
jgi:hypothetical protein